MRAVVLLVMGAAACRDVRPTSNASATASANASANANAMATATATATATASATAMASASAPIRVETDWCIDGVAALDAETCYVLPPLAEGKPRRLLVYLHGVVPPTPDSVQKQTVENAVKNAATRAGAAALVPRGVKGIGPEQARDWWAWPTDPATHDKLAKPLLARIAAAKKKLEAIAGAPFERTYLAGSSNGAYFLTALAVRGDPDADGLPIDGYGAMSGGAGGRTAPNPPHRFYIGYGAYDPETKNNVRSLVASLEAAHWPMRVAVHPFGHGAREIYIDEAFAFWDEP